MAEAFNFFKGGPSPRGVVLGEGFVGKARWGFQVADDEFGTLLHGVFIGTTAIKGRVNGGTHHSDGWPKQDR